MKKNHCKTHNSQPDIRLKNKNLYGNVNNGNYKKLKKIHKNAD